MPTILDTSGCLWGVAKKTVDIYAKHVTAVASPGFLHKLKLDTLEGLANIGDQNMICRGGVGDVWQQDPVALLRKYDVIGVTIDGWLVCRPKPENEVQYFEITPSIAGALKDGYIQGTWGSTIDGVEKLQAWKVGDFICRQPTDHVDQWVVRRAIFQNTYSSMTSA